MTILNRGKQNSFWLKRMPRCKSPSQIQGDIMILFSENFFFISSFEPKGNPSLHYLQNADSTYYCSCVVKK